MNKLKIDVLDHGFVKLRNLSGPTRRVFDEWPDGPDCGIRRFDADDTDPANTARMSFDNMDMARLREDDLKLCTYLMKNWHTSPFEMIECWIEMKLPIFVARQFVRHRTVSINEVSGRYVQLPKEWYIPKIVGGKAKSAKQGQENNLNVELQNIFKKDLDEDCLNSYAKYEFYLKQGVAPEHARMFLSLNHYTHWIWKQDLHNMLNFLRLRDHSHAQIEAQVYAKAIDSLLRKYLPHTMSLYDKYRRLDS
jgi:thymidylate synthase (FAD)